ncbi:hypothetical protein MMC22_001172 [Lobaria immixta]|nr:hypothetical protein [Lobaria immixta]
MASTWVPSNEVLIDHTHGVINHHLSQVDASQNYDQVCLVLGLSQKILDAERVARPEVHYNSTIITLSILLHSLASKHQKAVYMETPLSFLLELFCPTDIANAVQNITDAISFSTEKSSPSLVQSLLRAHPELAIVQDAHRLNSIGATGIGRFFTFEGSVKGKNQDMNETVKHQMERCDEIEGMMKTQEGKRMAAARTEKVKLFGRWWEEEQNMKA